MTDKAAAFIHMLARDPRLRARFDREPASLLDEHGVFGEDRSALLSRDKRRIDRHLAGEEVPYIIYNTGSPPNFTADPVFLPEDQLANSAVEASAGVRGGSLTVVGTGYLAAGQLTVEAEAAIASADTCLFATSDPASTAWLLGKQPRARSMHDLYQAGKPRQETYRDMVEHMLAPLREGQDVCAVFYGHPGVFVFPSHAAVRQARREGFAARMLAAVSAEDCLFADLGIDPASHGCQSFEATDFLVRPRAFDVSSHLILWQVGLIGTSIHAPTTEPNRKGLEVLVDVLARHYPSNHATIVYEAAVYSVCHPVIRHVELNALPQAAVPVMATLYVPPLGMAAFDRDMLARLGMPQPT